MDITYLGHSSFKIIANSEPYGVKQKVSIITDPFDPDMVGMKYSGVEADIVTVSHDHEDHNRSDLVKGVKKVLSGPGEYEISGISFIGIASFHDGLNGKKRGRNTIFIIEAEGLRLAHLGDLGHTLSNTTLEQMGDIDILMVPVGGEYTIGPKQASEVAGKIDPCFIIPMHYQVSDLNPKVFSKLAPVDIFLKETGLIVEKTAKFSIKKEEVTQDAAAKIILLGKK